MPEEGKSLYLQHANKRNVRRIARTEEIVKGEYLTTSRADYSPQHILGKGTSQLPEVHSPAPSLPFRRHKKLSSVQESLQASNWPADPQAGAHHKTKHQNSSWVRMHLSGGTIH